MPDALEAYYGNRKPKLKGSFAEMFGPGSNRLLLSYEESDPIHGVTYSYKKSGSYGYSGKEIFDEDGGEGVGMYHKSTSYNIHVREETTTDDKDKVSRPHRYSKGEKE